MSPRRWQADLALASVALIWGSTFVLVKSALDDVSTVLFLALRFALATAALAAIFRFRGTAVYGAEPWIGGILTGIFLYAGYLMQTLGLRHTSAAKAGFITGLYVVLVPILSAIVYRKTPSLSEWAGVATAAVGMALLTLDTARFQVATGDLLVLGCAFAFAAHILVLGHYSRRLSPLWLALAQIGTCAVFGMGTFWWVEAVFLRPSGTVWVALGVTSILATALAFLVQTWGQRYTTVTRTAIIFALEPVFAWLTSYLFANEVLTPRAMTGAGCILAGILLVELKPLEMSSDPQS